jgi:ABC-type multidrug transport system fused ATPase/permease subunit
MALVSQEPLLFSKSIIDNIRYGSPGATLQQVEAAARAANAHDFIEGLPEKYHTQVGVTRWYWGGTRWLLVQCGPAATTASGSRAALA